MERSITIVCSCHSLCTIYCPCECHKYKKRNPFKEADDLKSRLEKAEAKLQEAEFLARDLDLVLAALERLSISVVHRPDYVKEAIQIGRNRMKVLNPRR